MGEPFFVVLDFMVKELQLKGLERDVFAIVYGYSQKEDGCYWGSQQTLADRTGFSRIAVNNALKRLTERGLLIQHDIYKNNTRYCAYETNTEGVKKLYRGCKETLQGVSSNFTGGCKETLHNNKYDNKEENKSNFTVNDFKDLWNEWKEKYAPAVSKLEVITEARSKKFTARQKTFADKGANSRDFWVAILYVIANSKNGAYIGNGSIKEGYTKPWTITFDWLFMNDERIARFLEVVD